MTQSEPPMNCPFPPVVINRSVVQLFLKKIIHVDRPNLLNPQKIRISELTLDLLNIYLLKKIYNAQ